MSPPQRRGRTHDVVVLGNLLVDDVVYADGRTRMAQPGGAALYFALAARLWSLRVGVVSVRGEEYPAQTLTALDEKGIDLAGVRSLDGPGLRTWLLYEGRRRRVVHRLEGPSHAAVSPSASDIPEGWRPGAVHLAPLPFELHRELVAALGGRDLLLSLDPYELLDPREVERWRPLLESVDLFFLSEDELETAAGEEPDGLFSALLGGRLSQILFKRGASGGLLYDRDRPEPLPWRSPEMRVVDPTGAGDAFAAGVLAGRLRGENVLRGIHRGIVGASFALEGSGPDALLEATPSAAENRLQGWFGDGGDAVGYGRP